MAESKVFVAVDPTKFTTAKEFIDESKRLSSFQGCKELIVVDALGNRDTVEDVSLLALWTLQRTVGLCRRALRGDAEAFVACYRKMGTESNLENWRLIDANTGESVDCRTLNLCKGSYAQLILQSLLASDTGIVAAPNGQQVYAEVT
jgi:hypothetical protein